MGQTKRLRKKRKQNTDPPPASVHHDLYKVLSSQGWQNANHLTVTNFPLTGRGLRAKCNLSEHDLIIELPLQSMISYLTLQNDADFVGLFDSDELKSAKSSVNFQSLLALYLVSEKLKGEDSRWIAYLKTLPEAFTMPYFCKKIELYCLPESLLETVVEQNETIKKNYQELMRILKPEHRDNFLLDTFKWAYFVCNSRSVYIKGKSLEPLVDDLVFKEILSDSPNMALAPLLDLLNHSDQATTKSQLTHSEGFISKNSENIKGGEVKISYQLFTLKPVKKHDQIFINYGSFNNTKLLLEYGFSLPNNRMDFLEFSLNDVNNYIKNHRTLNTLLIPKHKYKFIRDHELDQQMFIDVNDGLNHNLKAVIGILLVPQNIYNLTQVAFGEELNFDDIKDHATEIVKQKRLNLEKMYEGLERQSEMSRSGSACCEYFKESIKLIDKVLEFVENF
jgi:SET domain